MSHSLYRPGDRVRFNTHSNLGMCEDTVRETFTQTDSLGRKARALVLTNYSWCYERDARLIEAVEFRKNKSPD